MGVLLYDFVMNMLPFSSGLLLAVVKTIYFEHFKGCHVIIYNLKNTYYMLSKLCWVVLFQDP